MDAVGDMRASLASESWDVRVNRAVVPVQRQRRARCLACDRPTFRASSYCRPHLERVRKGHPVDANLAVIGVEERKRMSSGIRFGGGLNFTRSTL